MSNNTPQWFFNSANGQIIAGDNTLIVSIDDINPKVAERIVELNNAGEYSKISSYLEQTSLCAPDEREFLNEQLSAYRTLVVSKLPTLDEIERQKNMKSEDVVIDALKRQGLSAPETKKENPRKGVPQGPRTPASTNGKTLTPEKAIQSLEEQIQALQDKKTLIEWFNGITVPEIPESISTVNKKLLVEYTRQSENLVSTYLGQIANM